MYYMVLRRFQKEFVLTLEYACCSSTEKPVICHADLSFKRDVSCQTFMLQKLIKWEHSHAETVP